MPPWIAGASFDERQVAQAEVDHFRRRLSWPGALTGVSGVSQDQSSPCLRLSSIGETPYVRDGPIPKGIDLTQDLAAKVRQGIFDTWRYLCEDGPLHQTILFQQPKRLGKGLLAHSLYLLQNPAEA